MSSMVANIEDIVIERLRALPPERRKEVLDFVEFLAQQAANDATNVTNDLYGLWADLDVHVSASDIEEARREMWGNFPRDL
jgi:hypothetical protein